MREPVCLSAEVRPVPGLPGYHVSAAGEVFGPRGRRRLAPGTEGYLQFSVRRWPRRSPSVVRVHTAVLLAFVGPAPAGMEGRHVDGDLANNALENLTWSTHVVNCADKERHGTLRGRVGRAGLPKAVLTEADVAAMRGLWPGVSIRALAERFGVGRTTAGDVVRGRTWRGV